MGLYKTEASKVCLMAQNSGWIFIPAIMVHNYEIILNLIDIGYHHNTQKI